MHLPSDPAQKFRRDLAAKIAASFRSTRSSAMGRVLPDARWERNSMRCRWESPSRPNFGLRSGTGLHDRGSEFPLRVDKPRLATDPRLTAFGYKRRIRSPRSTSASPPAPEMWVMYRLQFEFRDQCGQSPLFAIPSALSLEADATGTSVDFGY